MKFLFEGPPEPLPSEFGAKIWNGLNPWHRISTGAKSERCGAHSYGSKYLAYVK